MTRAEFYKEYGKLKVKFSSYYKYTFTYMTTLDDGSVLTCKYGGNQYDIYRHDVANDGEEVIEYLQPFAGTVYKDGKEICSFYDF